MAKQSFGPLSAETDSQLLNYFHKTSFINELLTLPAEECPFLIVSRPGAGKTALKKWLMSKDSPFKPISLDQKTGRVFISDEQFNDEDYRLLIRAELLTGVLGEFISHAPEKKKGLKGKEKHRHDAYSRAKTFIEKDWWTATKSFFKERFSGLQILGTGFSLNKDERREYLNQLRRRNIGDRALETLENLVKYEDQEFCLIVDNPEFIVGEGTNLTDPLNAIRIGALFKVLSEIHLAGLRVTAFTRFHVLDGVQENFIDYSHFADGIARLEWTKEDLLEFVTMRVEKRLNTNWDSVFSIKSKAFAEEIFPNLVNGPRDLLILLGQAKALASSGKISKKNLKTAISHLRKEKYNDVSRLKGKIYPGIAAFCKAAISILKELPKPLTINSINTKISSKISDPNTVIHEVRIKYPWIIDILTGDPPATEILETLGALVFVIDGQPHYPWEGYPIELLEECESVEILPLFLN